MNIRPPATPIINVDPYFSIWTTDSIFNNTVHWTGKPNTITGYAYIDGVKYHFLGYNERQYEKSSKMELISFNFDAFSTRMTYEKNGVRLKVHFTSPMLPDDLYYASRPVGYCKVTAESSDGRAHSVNVGFSVSEELVINHRGDSRVISNDAKIPGFTAMKMGNAIQKPLNRCGDDIRIDWGYFYLAVKGDAKASNTSINGLYAINIEAEIESDRLFIFAYDDIDSILYFGDALKAYWKSGGKTIEDAIIEANDEYDNLLNRCNRFSDELCKNAEKKGSKKYAELLALSLRQVMAAHKLVVDKEGNNLYISKECNSNGCAATVDVTYPSAPLYLLYNTELLKGMLRPIMKYAASDEWKFDFAPHDVGTYPILGGQNYGIKRDCTGKVISINRDAQMPVEECGNMIILFSAICDADGNADFAKPHLDTLRNWNEYLINYGLDPENQNCTDDFAGHLAHNVNLAIKATMGIAAFGKILKHLGDEDGYEKMIKTSKEYAASIVERAKNNDGSYRLTFDNDGSFSLKYNAIWDKIWKTELFPAEFFDGEIERYKKEQLYYGTPLDSRNKYTKSDWLVWASSLASNKKDFEILTDKLWDAYNTMRSYYPMSDWYYCDTSHMRGMYHRTVQGGLFIKLMLD